MIARDVSYQPRLKTFETGHKNNMRTCRIKKNYHPIKHDPACSPVINGVLGRSVGRGRGASLSLAREARRGGKLFQANHLMRALLAWKAAMLHDSWHFKSLVIKAT